ncbi:MAG: inositol monophosphatase [Planctomycetota bacterium]|nr:inositol monophosphatase [Planctomycetota bacterium]
MVLLNFAVDVAKEAGEILLKRFGNLKSSDIDYKGRWNVVTTVDTEVERLIVKRIEKEFPNDGILAEENARKRTDAERVWLVDPLDGTVNYAHGLPFFCVSIAVAKGWKMEAGVVYSPCTDELFYAERGGGAFLNKRRINVSSTSDFSKSLLATGFAYVRNETEHNNLANFNRLNLKVEGIRRLGSAAIDLCYVAAGRFDGFWELFLSPWDVAAGSLIVEEAGGIVTDIAGGDDYLFGFNIVAGNEKIHDELRRNLEPFPERFRFKLS